MATYTRMTKTTQANTELKPGGVYIIHEGQYYTPEEHKAIKRMQSQNNTELLRAGM